MADYGDHSGLCSQEGAPLFSAEDAISTMASETEFLVDKEVVIPQEATNRPAGDRTSVLGRLLPNSTCLSDSSRNHNPGTSLGPENTPTVGLAVKNNSATAPVASQPPHTKFDLTIVQQYAEEKQPKPKEALGAKLHPDLEKQIKVCWTEDASQDEIIEAITPKFPTSMAWKQPSGLKPSTLSLKRRINRDVNACIGITPEIRRGSRTSRMWEQV